MASLIQTFSSKILSLTVKYFRWVAIAWAIILLLIGIFIFILPKWNEISELGLADYKTELDRLDKKEAYLKDLIKMVEAYNRINQTQINELKKVIPEEEDYAGLFVTMDQLTKQSGFELVSIDIAKEQVEAEKASAAASPEEKSATQTKENKASASTALSNIKTLDIAITLSGSSDYKLLKNFLNNLEKNLRLMDASTISFTALEATGGAVASGGFSVNLKTYYLEKLASDSDSTKIKK
jgi:hypothetical protein